eukprot:scpid102305/ scgid23901/ 
MTATAHVSSEDVSAPPGSSDCPYTSSVILSRTEARASSAMKNLLELAITRISRSPQQSKLSRRQQLMRKKNGRNHRGAFFTLGWLHRNLADFAQIMTEFKL